MLYFMIIKIDKSNLVKEGFMLTVQGYSYDDRPMEQLSDCVHSQEAESLECWSSVCFFSFLCNLGSMQWLHPLSGWVFLPLKYPGNRYSWVILNPVKLTVKISNHRHHLTCFFPTVFL